jgi:hypothetical protein
MEPATRVKVDAVVRLCGQGRGLAFNERMTAW